jgi:hypothetical protein
VESSIEHPWALSNSENRPRIKLLLKMHSFNQKIKRKVSNNTFGYLSLMMTRESVDSTMFSELFIACVSPLFQKCFPEVLLLLLTLAISTFVLFDGGLLSAAFLDDFISC